MATDLKSAERRTGAPRGSRRRVAALPRGTELLRENSVLFGS